MVKSIINYDVPRYAGVTGELITGGRQKTRNHGYDVIVGGELFTDYSDHPRKLFHAKPKTQITGAGRYQLLSVGGMPTATAWPERLLSEKSGRCALQQMRSVALYL